LVMSTGNSSETEFSDPLRVKLPLLGLGKNSAMNNRAGRWYKCE